MAAPTRGEVGNGQEGGPIVLGLIDILNPDSDVVRTLRPRGVLRLLLRLLQVRGARLEVRDRGATITKVAQILSSGCGGRVSSHGPGGDRWSVTVPTHCTVEPDGCFSEVR